MEEDSRAMPPIPVTCDVSLGFKCGDRRGRREKVNGAVNLRKTQRRSSTLQCRREASKSFNVEKTDAINISFERHVMLDDDTKLSDMAVTQSQIEFVNAVHGRVTYG